jgi:L-alanine-DL-glutamate epimerase-like enolase superfamily enzyme
VRVSTRLIEARWRAPLASAHGGSGTEPRPLVLLELGTRDGVVGHGEAAPLESYDGVSAAAVLAGVDACAGVLADADGLDRAATLAACATRTGLPQALAAIDLALWDLAGRRAGQPVWRLLGATVAPRLEINAVIGAVDAGAAVAEATRAVQHGYRCLKLKIGVGDDLGRVRAVREAVGPQAALRLDANGAYPDTETALDALGELSASGIELCEEPVHGAHALAAVAGGSAVRVAADESTTDPDLFEARCATAMCLKIAAGGGISGVLSQAARARALGYELYLASTLDGPLGIAAALQVAAVLGPDRPCGLSTLERFEAASPIVVDSGWLAPPAGPGLGDGLLGWYDAVGA